MTYAPPSQAREGGGDATLPTASPAASVAPGEGGSISLADVSSSDPTPAGSIPAGRGIFLLAVARCWKCRAEFVPAQLGAIKCQPCSAPKPATPAMRAAARRNIVRALAWHGREVLPPMSPPQARMYRKLREHGVARDAALAEAMR